jgi:hypothetical protein
MSNHSDELNAMLAKYGIAPWTEEEMAGVWECDGCHIRGTFDEMGDHVESVGQNADGSLKNPEDVTCWGSMKVGSSTWIAYWDKGIHPMQSVLSAIDAAVTDQMEEQFPPKID